RHEAAYVYLPCPPVDINNTDIATERVCQIRRIIVVDRLQTWLQVWWAVRVGRKRQFLNGLALARRSFHIESSRLPFKILLAHLQQVGCYLFGLVSHFSRSQRSCSASHRGATTGVCAQPIWGGIGITMLDINIVWRHTQF